MADHSHLLTEPGSAQFALGRGAGNSHGTAGHRQGEERSTKVPAPTQRKRCAMNSVDPRRRILTTEMHPAKKLKSAWIQTRKIKSKWNAEKRRQGIQMELPELETTVSKFSRVPTGQKPDHQPQLTDVDTESGVSPPKSRERPVKASNSRTIREPVRTAKTGPATGSSQQKDHRSDSGRPSGYQGKKPSMRNRMNALLEKIQREID